MTFDAVGQRRKNEDSSAKGIQVFLDHAVDAQENMQPFFLRPKRNVPTARPFFQDADRISRHLKDQRIKN